MGFHIAIKDNKAEIHNFKLSTGIEPECPHYKFIGIFSTRRQAERKIPSGVEYKGVIQ